MLEAEVVGFAPPMALIVIQTAGVETQIAANRRHRPVTGTGNRVGGLGDGRETIANEFVLTDFRAA